ncbi:hypothetical protein DFH09DRAFT_1114592 [Mycena vulgaris]|nr:hypothetical protein DFH09DRAFT_1114592 [Mycena vulgaris]
MLTTIIADILSMMLYQFPGFSDVIGIIPDTKPFAALAQRRKRENQMHLRQRFYLHLRPLRAHTPPFTPSARCGTPRNGAYSTPPRDPAQSRLRVNPASLTTRATRAAIGLLARMGRLRRGARDVRGVGALPRSTGARMLERVAHEAGVVREWKEQEMKFLAFCTILRWWRVWWRAGFDQ